MSSKGSAGKPSSNTDDEDLSDVETVNKVALARAIARYIIEVERRAARVRQSRKLD